jgi:serine-type D-Ala-D-Ala carboxypeptidase
MTLDFSAVERVINEAFPGIPAAQLCVARKGEVIYSQAFGFLDPETRQRPTTTHTRFDMASVSKLFTTTAFMTLVEQGKTGLDNPVCSVVPEFSGLRPIAPYEAPLEEGAFLDVSEGWSEPVDAGTITFYHLLTHTSGLPAWRPFYLLANATAARWSVLTSYFSYRPSTRVLYSDLGLILTGIALERLSGKRLDAVITEHVIEPLGLIRTGYIPVGAPVAPDADIAPTEICRWRKRRLFGEVDDENTGRLDGIAGHAGIFSTAEEIALLGQSYLHASLLRTDTISEMTRMQAAYPPNPPRGIGFQLWLDDPEYSFHPLSPRTFGHTGFTGTNVWIDPERQVVIAFLTNEVYNGRQHRIIGEVRPVVHRAIVDVLDEKM